MLAAITADDAETEPESVKGRDSVPVNTTDLDGENPPLYVIKECCVA